MSPDQIKRWHLMRRLSQMAGPNGSAGGITETGEVVCVKSRTTTWGAPCDDDATQEEGLP